MPDTRRVFEVGKPMSAGGQTFKPGQPPYIVSKDSTVSRCIVHVNLDKLSPSGKWGKKVDRFHVSFKNNRTPQSVIVYQWSADKYVFKEWPNFSSLGLPADEEKTFAVAVGSYLNKFKKALGNPSVDIEAPRVPEKKS